jgi:hypothetical protein
LKILTGIVPKLSKLLGKIKPKPNSSKYNAPSCNCFTAGTKVLTDEGEKNIEDIEVGDKVLAKDEVTGEQAYKEVTHLYRNTKEIIYELTVGNQVIETTDNHPFWVEGKGWVLAADLQVRDKLQQSNGNTLTIDNIKIVKHDELVKVYNFTVADFHTYFVSDLGIWVHNIKCFTADAIRKIDAKILDLSEGRGTSKSKGHMLEKHVSQTNEDLIKRTHNESVPATSFTDKSTASKAVLENIRKNANGIASWLNDTKADTRKTIETSHSYSIGKGVNVKGQNNNGSNKVHYDLKKSRIVLVKDEGMEQGFRILTGFPIF